MGRPILNNKLFGTIYFFIIFSGTYNNQWMIVDYNLLKSSRESVDGEVRWNYILRNVYEYITRKYY